MTLQGALAMLLPLPIAAVPSFVDQPVLNVQPILRLAPGCRLEIQIPKTYLDRLALVVGHLICQLGYFR